MGWSLKFQGFSYIIFSVSRNFLFQCEQHAFDADTDKAAMCL